MSQESELITICNTVLNKLKRFGALDFRRIHVQGIPTRGGGKRKNPQKGMFDFMIVANGFYGWFECKSDIGELSEAQKDFARLQEIHGHARIGIGRSQKDLIIFLQEKMGLKL